MNLLLFGLNICRLQRASIMASITSQSVLCVCMLSAREPIKTCSPGTWKESPPKLDKQGPDRAELLRRHRPSASTNSSLLCYSFSFSGLAMFLLLFCLCLNSLTLSPVASLLPVSEMPFRHSEMLPVYLDLSMTWRSVEIIIKTLMCWGVGPSEVNKVFKWWSTSAESFSGSHFTG